jgi:hypothetical protein
MMKGVFVEARGNPVSTSAGRKWFHLALWIVALLVLSGCAVTKVFTPHVSPGNGKALVYFIRDSYPPHQREAQLYVNQRQVATMADDDAVAINVPLGDNSILVTVNGDNPIAFDLPISREEIIYIALTGDVRWTNTVIYRNTMQVELTRHIQAHRITKEQAMGLPETIRRKLE